MVNWLHIIWVAPAFAILGFLFCALLVGGKLESIESSLWEANRKLHEKCFGCTALDRAQRAEGDRKALIEEMSTLKRSNSQLRSMLVRAANGVKR